MLPLGPVARRAVDAAQPFPERWGKWARVAGDAVHPVVCTFVHQSSPGFRVRGQAPGVRLLPVASRARGNAPASDATEGCQLPGGVCNSRVDGMDREVGSGVVRDHLSYLRFWSYLVGHPVVMDVSFLRSFPRTQLNDAYILSVR